MSERVNKRGARSALFSQQNDCSEAHLATATTRGKRGPQTPVTRGGVISGLIPLERCAGSDCGNGVGGGGGGL